MDINQGTTGIAPSTYPPSYADRADGLNNRPGTPTPEDLIHYNTSLNGATSATLSNPVIFEEASDSPEIERAEQDTVVHRWRVDKYTGIDFLNAVGRGYLMKDSNGVITKVLSNRVTYQKPDYWLITLTSEVTNGDTPPDEFNLTEVELNPGLEKHPRYIDLTYKQRYIVRQANLSDAQDVANTYTQTINTIASAGGTLFQQNEAQEMLFKLHKGEESFYLPGYKISWSQYYWYPQELNGGGYIEDPILEGELPAQFWSTLDPTQSPDPTQNIFSGLAYQNPVIYGEPNDNGSGGGMSWLRLADTMEFNRTWFKIIRSWQGGPLGQWDQELYNTDEFGNPLPYQTNENSTGIVF